MSTTNEKDLTYEEAKELCRKAFDGGVTYGTESMRYGVNAVAYDWEHWLKENERLFTPPPTIESTLREFALEIDPSADSRDWRGDNQEVCREAATKERAMSANDLLKLLALRDKVLVTDDSTGENLYEGHVEDVPGNLRALTPHGFCASADYFDCYDITYVIEVVR